MKISVVVPVKNEEKIIQVAVDYLLRQTVLPNEVIVVDNGSSDQTVGKVKEMKATFKSKGIALYVYACAPGNQIEARTMGFGVARHDLIVSIDADTQLEPHWIERARHIFAAQSALVGASGVTMYNNKLVSALHRLVLSYYLINPRGYFFYGSNAVFRRQAYAQCGGLTGCRAAMEQLQLGEPHDDLYLSYQLKKSGLVRPFKQLRACAMARDYSDDTSLPMILRRTYRQMRESLALRRYLKKCNRM